ncbi:MAG: TrkA family potassium uptake protein [Polyangiaceae bacterium]|nr:TrkA family potassium uptake protein [Polyangiaceae bacterium]
MGRKRVLVIGLGRFGSAIVDTLWQSGAEVIAVDEDAEAVDAVKDRTSAAFVGDATSVKVLEGIGAKDVDAAVVTYGERFEPAVLCVASLVRLGVPQVIARAATDRQADVLRAVGATRVVQLEAEMGNRLATDITMPLAVDLMEVASHYRVVPWNAHGPLVGHTLATAGLRQRYRINVIGVRRKAAPAPSSRSSKPRIEPPTPEYVILDGDTLLLVGDADDVARFVADFAE